MNGTIENIADHIDTGECLICRKTTEKRCTGCKVAFYCSPEHQKQHWGQHKDECKPFEVCCSQSGKYLKTSRDLEQGEIILIEEPLVIGPRVVTVAPGEPFPCIGCCRSTAQEVAKECSGCGWPCCSSDCPGLKDVKKHGLECKILKLGAIRGVRTFYQYFRFDLLVALRTLLLQSFDNNKWNQLLCLEDHLHERCPETDEFEKTNERVKFLEENFLKTLKPGSPEARSVNLPEITGDLVHKLYGIIETNSLGDPGNANAILLYPTANSFEQNCIPNTCRTVEEDTHAITFRASLPIMKGEHLTTAYAGLLLGTYARRKELEKRYLSCSCSRCRDPTESETFASALMCMGMEKQPCRGVQLPLKCLDSRTKWLCCKCKIRLPNRDIVRFVKHLTKEVDKVLGNGPCVKELEDLLEKLGNFLHENHYLMLKVKYDLIPLYTIVANDNHNKQKQMTARKIGLCHELIEMYKKLDPGNARLTINVATVLRELIICKFSMLKQWFTQETKDNFIDDIKEIRSLLEEAKHTLQYELKTTLGAKLYNEICDHDQEFNQWLVGNNSV